MIAALRGCGVSVQIGARVARRTESGLQAHPLIFYKLRTQNRKHDVKHDAGTEGRNEEQEAYEGFARLAADAGKGCRTAAAEKVRKAGRLDSLSILRLHVVLPFQHTFLLVWNFRSPLGYFLAFCNQCL